LALSPDIYLIVFIGGVPVDVAFSLGSA